MFDVSCQVNNNQSLSIQNVAFTTWSNFGTTDPIGSDLQLKIQLDFQTPGVGQHYFVEQNGALVPVWDLTMTASDAIDFGQVIQSAFSPDGPTNIDWREFNQLPGLPGSLANQIYEIDTVQGQPPFGLGVSSSLDLCLSCSINVNYCSAPLALIHLSSMLQITVRVHDVDDCRIAIINLRVSSLYLKAVGAERPRANGIRTTNVHDFLKIKLHFVGPRTCIALFLSLSLPSEHLPVDWHSHH